MPASSPHINNRRAIRKDKRAARNQLTQTQQYLHARKICNFLQKTPEFLRSKNVAFYLHSDGEVNLDLIIHYAIKAGKQCFLPCIEKKTAKKKFTLIKNSSAKQEKSMIFRRYIQKHKLIKNIFGIYEPNHKSQSIAIKNIDLVIMPLVSFDKKGNRLGMGGGFYDRAFNCKLRFPYSKPDLIGVAHYCQMTDSIPHQPWDVPLKNVITENGTMRAKR